MRQLRHAAQEVIFREMQQGYCHIDLPRYRLQRRMHPQVGESVARTHLVRPFSYLPNTAHLERKKPTRQKTKMVTRRVGLLFNEPFGFAELFFIQSSEESCAVRATTIECNNAAEYCKHFANSQWISSLCPRPRPASLIESYRPRLADDWGPGHASGCMFTISPGGDVRLSVGGCATTSPRVRRMRTDNRFPGSVLPRHAFAVN